MKANKLIGSLICGWSTSFAVGQDSASIKGYKQPTCEEMRDALKQRAGGRHVNRPDPSNPNNLRGVWVWEEDEVGGKSSKEIDEASCEQIAGLYAKEIEGFQSGVVDEYGWPRLLKETIASSAKKSPQVPLGGPSLAAPGLKPDLKTGEYPQPIDPNLTNEQWIAAFQDIAGSGPAGFHGGALDAAVAAAQDALAAGKGHAAATEAGLMAGLAARPVGAANVHQQHDVVHPSQNNVFGPLQPLLGPMNAMIAKGRGVGTGSSFIIGQGAAASVFLADAATNPQSAHESAMAGQHGPMLQGWSFLGSGFANGFGSPQFSNDVLSGAQNSPLSAAGAWLGGKVADWSGNSFMHDPDAPLPGQGLFPLPNTGSLIAPPPSSEAPRNERGRWYMNQSRPAPLVNRQPASTAWPKSARPTANSEENK